MSVTLQSLPRDAVRSHLNEFFVPTILNFDSDGKTSEEHSPEVETIELVSRQNGDFIANEDEEVSQMSPKKKAKGSCKDHSSFLLQPFLKPVDPHIESDKENPVLKALFGGKSPPGLSSWAFATKTSINNCHPFKKTELSHDLTSDDTPAEIPKSLLKKTSRTRRRSSVKEDDIVGVNANVKKTSEVLKEINLNANPSNTLTASSSLNCNVISKRRLIPSSTALKAQQSEGSCLQNKRKRITSQITFPVPRPRLSFVNSARLIELKALVDNAIKNHKVYSMTGCYNSVRTALKQRGWIEKIDSEVKNRNRVNKFEEIGIYDAAFQFVQKNQSLAAMALAIQTSTGFAHNDQIRYSGQGEAEIINRMLKNVTEDLCWLSRPFPYYCCKDFDKFDMINRLPRAYFSNKVGLCNSLQQIQWFYETGVCSTQYPRTYNTSVRDELQAFKDDFRLTSCIGLLKWFYQNFKNGGERAVRSPDGKVDLNVIEFALRRCAEFVKTKQHEDIDIAETQTVWEYQWDNFITQYYKIVNEGHILRDNKEGISIKAIASNVQAMLNILKPYWPQYDIDGYQNFWIIKPGGRCCGAGIVIKNHLDQILLTLNPTTMRDARYVVQKYIERPLLIYNTKFDIRQWFLVTSVYPLTVWMYRESYLRFCSQPFTLKNTHESIHLCNNAVQRKYKNGKRDRGLPDENMWDCYTFQTYLKAIGYPDAWEKYIYPGMKESFVGALLTSQESMERRKNCFELYGADFMLSDTLTDGPWLIEINSNPAMDSSTSVTARMCPQVLEDIIKVVIDRRDNRSASTGGFEMVFRQNCPPVPPYLGMSFCVKGKKAFKANADTRLYNRKSKSKYSTDILNSTDTEDDTTSHETFSAGTTASVPSQKPGKTYNKNFSDRVSNHSKQNKINCDENFQTLDSVEKNLQAVDSSNSLIVSNKISNAVAKKSSQHKWEIFYDCHSQNSLNNSIKSSDTIEEEVTLNDFTSNVKKSKSQSSSKEKFHEKSEILELESELEKNSESIASFSSCNSGSQVYLENNQNWKSTVQDIQQNCSKLLATLQYFQKENSRSRSQESLKKTQQKFKQYVSAGSMSKEKVVANGKVKEEEENYMRKGWDCEEPLDLAINIETGAVKSFSEAFRQVKQKKDSLLLNKSNAFDKKICMKAKQ